MEVFLGQQEKDHTLLSVPRDVRRKHIAVFAKSAAGKTTLLRNIILSDLHAGNGLTAIPPHGPRAQELLDCIPPHRTNDVIYLNPAHPDRVIGLNVLQSVGRAQRSLVVSSIISILRNLYPHNWGPRTEYILEHVVYALLEQKQPVTLAAVPKLLIDHNYRKQILQSVSDPAVQSFFYFYEQQNDRL